MRHTAIVSEIESLAPNVIQLTVAFEGEFHFTPGQWVSFGFPEGPSRAYTIASAPQRPEAVQLCVRIGPGRGGEALKNLQPGAEVKIDGPFGEFVIPDHERRDVVLLAGDVGIAPVRSIVLHLLAVDDARRIVVLYEPDQRHILYAGDFDPLARAGRITHESGPIATLIARNRTIIKESVLMAAGFDGFLDRVRQALRSVEIDPSALLWETFGPEP